MDLRILVVDDEARIRFVLTKFLKDSGYKVKAVESGEEALKTVNDFMPHLIILDLELPGISGLETFTKLQKQECIAKTIILTAYGSIASAVEAMQIGAYSYLTKPFDNNGLLITIQRACEQLSLEQELKTARDRLDKNLSLNGIVAINSKMKNLFGLVKKIAPTDASLLILGESGTGKELFANAIHQHSLRKNKSFVALNCGAIPNNLIESELFGFKKGAFSGAEKSKPGMVEQADGGTLFLDEVGDLSADAQVKLLRFLQSGEFTPVGSVEPQQVDVRVLAATNRNLKKGIEDGSFRSDLFYRLNVITFEIPPLRKRTDDIPILVEHFLDKIGSSLHKQDFKFSQLALDTMQLHNWPGNVRELENAVHGALVMSSDSVISIDSLPTSLKENSAIEPDKLTEGSLPYHIQKQTELLEKKLISQALREQSGNQTKTAEQLGIGRRTLIRKLQNYGIKT